MESFDQKQERQEKFADSMEVVCIVLIVMALIAFAIAFEPFFFSEAVHSAAIVLGTLLLPCIGITAIFSV